MGPTQYESEKFGKFSEQNGLKGLQMVRYECPNLRSMLIMIEMLHRSSETDSPFNWVTEGTNIASIHLVLIYVTTEAVQHLSPKARSAAAIVQCHIILYGLR